MFNNIFIALLLFINSLLLLTNSNSLYATGHNQPSSISDDIDNSNAINDYSSPYKISIKFDKPIISSLYYELNNSITENIQSFIQENHEIIDIDEDSFKENITKTAIKTLEIYGYYSRKIDKVSIKKQQIKLKISPGKPTYISKLNLYFNNEAYSLKSLKKILKEQSSKSVTSEIKELNSLINNYKNYNKSIFNQTIFNQTRYEQFKSNLLDYLRNIGYLDVKINTHEVKVNRNKKEADINLNISLGKIYTINIIKINHESTHKHYNIIDTLNSSSKKSNNKISITNSLSDGNLTYGVLSDHKALSDNFILSFIPNINYKIIAKASNYNEYQITNNTAFTNNIILNLQNDIAKYVQTINIKTSVDSTKKQIKIIVNIQPIKNYLYNLGAGYDTNEGARAFGELEIRNITDFGHKLNLSTKIAQYRKLFSTQYSIPGFIPSTDLAQFGYQYRFDENISDNNIEKERHQVSSQYQRNLYNGKILYTGGISYREEKFKDYSLNKSHQSWLLVPYFIYTHVFSPANNTSWTNKITSNQAHRVHLLIEAADDSILSTTSFVKLHTKTKSIIPIKYEQTGLRAIIRAQYGEVWHNNKNKIPPTMRFFAGGLDSIRGYRFESLGPATINNKGKTKIIGGDKLAIFSAELEKHIYKNWSIATFYDVGNAVNSWKHLDNNLYAGAGFGVRWQSLIGPVRLDFANALDKKSKPWRIDFSVGPDL